ncbi:hypothetical protein [Actinomadura macrotermitis]|uniref:Uncharacterized protein n=1 Tax=Actinomadura macrotermitis TaxID=2585200 RepID=A0A7K0BUD1_9ACTN|nr:hypothetical protein [Actinomadura macrotermitis]MQY04805.1 hypothetical protein [Actinomadura macrotermitis]
MSAGREVAEALPLIALGRALQDLRGVEAWLVSPPATGAPYLVVRNTAPWAYGQQRVSVFDDLFVWPGGCVSRAPLKRAAAAIAASLDVAHEPGHRGVRAGCAIGCLGLDECVLGPLYRAGLRTVGELVKVARKRGLLGIRKIGAIRAVQIYGALHRAGFKVPPP